MPVASAALCHLSDVLAAKPELAADRMGLVLVQASQAYTLPAVLAMSRFLAHCGQRQQHEHLLQHIIRFLDDLPVAAANDLSHSEAAAGNFCLELVGYLEAIARDWAVASQALTTSLAKILGAEPLSPLCRAFLCALSTNCFALHESAVDTVRHALLQHWLQDKHEDILSAEVEALQRQRIGLRLFLHALAKANEDQVQPFWSAGARLLRALLPLLKLRKRDLPGNGGPVALKICLVFEASQAASVLQTKLILMRAKCSEGALWETLTLFMDAADACISSPWRRLRACECLFDSLLCGISEVVSARRDQTILHRLRLLVLRTCAYADTWGTNEGPFFQTVVKASCSVIQAAWNVDRPAAESFLLSLAAHIRQLSEQEEKEKQTMAVMQLNVIPLLADVAIKVNKVEAVDVIMPMFVESLEEGEASVPSLLRLRFLDAVARMACLGFEKSYREAVALLTKSYTDKLSTVGSAHSRTLAPEATTERVETLPAAFYAISARLEGQKLRSDYRLRLFTLCSEVGLAAEAKSGRSGADLLGPLLPAVAEICSDFRPSHAIEPSLLKLFRNLWFYIVLFGLAPPIQKTHSCSKSLVASVSSLGSMSAMALQAVAGPYLWNAQWSAAVQRITEATPPLVASSMKWLEDELELNALHNPGSRRGSNNEKAAVAQRAALAAALGGRVEASSMSSISGVKATYLLAVSFLEMLRFSSNGGVFRNSQGTVLSSLSCTLVYLETPQLTPDVRQCVYAIVHRAFDAAMNWLESTDKTAEDKETVLVAHATYLIEHLVHRNENIREMADVLLNQLRNRFPQALWNARCLNSLLSLVEAVPTDQSLLVRQRVREWITCSLLLAPATTQGLLQDHLLKTWQQDAGSSELLLLFSELRVDVSKGDASNFQTVFVPAVRAAAAAAAVGNAQNANIKVLSGVTSVNWKSTAMQRCQEAKTTTDAPEEASRTTFLDFMQSLQQFVALAEKGEQFDAGEYRKACLQATALLLSDVSVYRMASTEGFIQLLRLLCWCPAYIFTPAAMETGIFVWTWLLSAAPQLGCLMMSELVDAWLWTIDTSRGLFAAGIESVGPATRLRPHLTPGEPGAAVDPIEGILAHRLWLGFFLERFEVVKFNRDEELLLIGRLLQGSVNSPFTCHPAATGTFFTLMLLGLKFCSWTGQSTPSAVMLLLEDRIYRTCLGWFSVKPDWYDTKLIEPQSEVQAVVGFVQQLASTQHEHATEECSLAEKGKVKQLLLLLCQHEADRLETWAFPLRDFVPRLRVHADRWPDYARVAWTLDRRLALSLPARFPFASQLKSEMSTFVQEHLPELRRFPEALPYFVTPKAVEENSAVLQQLPHWAPCSITHALEFLTPPYKGHSRVMAYVLRVLESYPPERVLFFMPQLVQALRYDEGGLVEGYLMVAAKRSNLFAHILIWQLQGEETDETARESPVSKGNTLPEIVRRVKKRIIDSFTAEAFDLFIREFRLFDQVTSISGLLYPLPRDERRAAIRRELEKIQVEGDDLYLPTAPTKLVRGFKLDSGIPLQSAAKVPIMITFEVVDKDRDEEIQHQACIFKVGDDCRQDVLALQVIALLRDIFQAVGLDLYLFPYGVLPTGYGRGIIEVVPNTRSRNQMGEMSDGGLYELFQQDYGPVGSPRFEAARDNFITSSAGYAVASLLLQPKDRHNGNLLFDSEGRLVHIDFGFILETSPGGNLRFESAQFKLSHEMTQLIDPSGAMKSDTWNRFVSLCVKGYLAARQHMDGIVNTVLLMVDSGLPCFSRGDPIGNLRRRFHPEMCEREAANFMIRTCADAYNKWTTAGYDLIQYWQQGIEK